MMRAKRWSAIGRRSLLLVAGAAVVTAPWPTTAQQHVGKLPRVGWLAPGSSTAQDNLEEYRRGMRELGYVDSETVATEYVYADGQVDRLPGLAATLVAHGVDVMVTAGTPGCLAAIRATTTIPIVFAVSSDPLSTGVVASLARPGGNITGLSLMAADLSAKRLELLQLLLPHLSRIAVLWDASNPGMRLRVNETRLAAEQLKIAFYDAGARDLESLGASFAAVSERQPEALLVTAETFTNRHRDRIVEFTLKNRLAAMFEEEAPVRAGGLISYGPSVPAMFYRAASYVDKILKGAKPADLPVEEPTTFSLTINLKTAAALGLEIPPALLVRADKVIE
jgi:putative tryptophan/tyrosine transport system substrate-binding protein